MLQESSVRDGHVAEALAFTVVVLNRLILLSIDSLMMRSRMPRAWARSPSRFRHRGNSCVCVGRTGRCLGQSLRFLLEGICTTTGAPDTFFDRAVWGLFCAAACGHVSQRLDVSLNPQAREVRVASCRSVTVVFVKKFDLMSCYA